MKRNFRLLWLGIAAITGALMLSTTVNATTIEYDYFAEVTDCPFGDPAGPCGSPGAPGPIFVGSEILGFLIIDEAAVAAGIARADDILDFFFDVAGVFALSPAGGQSVGTDTELLFDAVGNVIGGLFTLNLPGLAGPDIDGLLLQEFDDVGSGEWQITIPAFGGALVNGGVAEIVRSVPEPGTIALLGIGLAGLGFVRRRKPS